MAWINRLGDLAQFLDSSMFATVIRTADRMLR